MQLAQQFVIDELVKLDVRAILADGVAPIRAHIARRASPPRRALARARDRGRRRARGGGRADGRAREGAPAADARGDPAAGRRGDVRAPRAGRREGAGDRRERAAEPDRARAPRGGARRAGGRERAQAGRGGGGRAARRGAGRRRARRAAAEREARHDRRGRRRAQLRVDARARARSTRRCRPTSCSRWRCSELAGQLGHDRAPHDHAGHAHAAAERLDAGAGNGDGVDAAPCVLVERPTEFRELLARHGTREQARFFLAARGRAIADVEERHLHYEETRARVLARDPADWRSATVAARRPRPLPVRAPTTSSSCSARTGWSRTSPSTSTASR